MPTIDYGHWNGRRNRLPHLAGSIVWRTRWGRRFRLPAEADFHRSSKSRKRLCRHRLESIKRVIIALMFTRRAFLGSSAWLASELFGAPRELEKLADSALREARKLKASYCDIRINRYRNQDISLRMSPLEVPGVSEETSFGFGVRVIANGAWGFAASPVATHEEIARIAREAVD